MTANRILPLPFFSIRNAGALIIFRPVPSLPIPAATNVLDFQMRIADPFPMGYLDTFRSSRSPPVLWERLGAQRSPLRRPNLQ